jgi:16S rRNA (cytidine1402-2'-O)-methyltransferase
VSAAPGTLHLIPVPLGDDPLALMALPACIAATVARLDVFVVENPKSARRHLKQLGYPKPLQEARLFTLDEHTPEREIEALLAPLLAGEDMGLMSEAGCPAVADPGGGLVRLAHAHGARVAPLVGPSSLLLALMASGLDGQHFSFHGYLPANKEERQEKLRGLEVASRQGAGTQIFIETPYRAAHMLSDILATCQDDTDICVARNLTLATESVHTRKVREWKKIPPEPNRDPAVFLLRAAPVVAAIRGSRESRRGESPPRRRQRS